MSAISSTAPRPLLRGWVHAVAARRAAAAAWRLWVSAADASVGSRVTIGIFGLSLVGLFAVSALYHVPRWDERRRWLLSRADVVMIQLFIAASFTPFAWHALDGMWRTGTLAATWTIGIGGAIVAASPITGPRWLAAGAYLAFGWSAVVPIWKIAESLPWGAITLIMAAGALYTFGAVVYATRRPDPWPNRFGFHEVFHVLVVIAGAVQVIAILHYVLPLG